MATLLSCSPEKFMIMMLNFTFRYLKKVNYKNKRPKWNSITHRSSSSCSQQSKEMAENRSETRTNPLGIQMLTSSLHKQIFSNESTTSATKDQKEAEEEEKVRQSIEHLKSHGLWGKENPVLPDVHVELPKLKGRHLDEHFRQLAIEQSDDYRRLVHNLANVTIPPMPKTWKFQPSWTKYNRDGTVESVDYPLEAALVFDVEVLVPEGDMPTMATAVSDTAWYSWCSKRLIEDHITIVQRSSTDDLVPLETKSDRIEPESGEWKKRIVVGHNVSYDRARIKEQYYVEGSQMRFLDTMSLHIASSGLTGLQRALYMSEETGSKRKDVEEAKAKARGPPIKRWMKVGSLNNLVDVHKLYCNGPPLHKDQRETFVNGTMTDVRKNFQDLMAYCARDVKATHEILHKLLPIFFKRFPHPVTFAGMLEMSCAYLPVNSNWERYISEAQMTYDDLQKEMKLLLTRLANDACELLHDNKYKNDPWLWDLNWQIKQLRSKKAVAEKKTKTKEINPAQKEVEISAEDAADITSIEKVPIEVKSVLDTAKNLYVKRPTMAGYPVWYHDLCPKPNPSDRNWTPGPNLISTQMQVTPKLLRMTWDGYPLYYSKKNGWGYLVPGNRFLNTDEETNSFPFKEITKLCKMPAPDTAITVSVSSLDSLWERILEGVAEPSEEARLWESVMIEREETKVKKTSKMLKESSGGDHHGNGPFEEDNIPGCYFYRLPHKDGPQNRVGNPLAKDFLNKIEDGTLSSSGSEQADYALKLGKMISYWRNAHKRIESQMVVWLKKDELPRSITESDNYNEDSQYGVIIPKIVTAGTVTRRAVEPTWLTASNAYPDRVGSELKSMVQAFPGYHFVGADVDSQELWIAAILGDAHFCKIHGCTAFGWMTLQGKKSNSTDMHSKTAATVGISRDQAKIMNYGRIYGAGQPFASRLLMQFNHRLTDDEAKARAQTMYAATKGVRGYILNNVGRKLMEQQQLNELEKKPQNSSDDVIVTRKEIFKLLRETRSGQEFNDVIGKSVWIGGTESAMFNKLEEIAMSPEAKTPVLNCSISRALESTNVMDNFITSRVNWVVQSSAVDYLHLMLVSMRWLFNTYDISGRFCISIHDEVRYHVKSEDRYRAALALQITNLLTRSLFAIKLGMTDLPQSVAFFSAVDIDTVLRKEVDLDCKTPSNLHGLQNGYGISPGIALDIEAIMKITDGKLNKT